MQAEEVLRQQLLRLIYLGSTCEALFQVGNSLVKMLIFNV